MKTHFTAFVTGALLIGSSAFAGTAQIGSGSLILKCRADVSNLMGQETYISVEMTQKADGKLSANVNGVTYNANIQPINYTISDKTLSLSPDSDEVLKLNDGERRLLTMKSMMEDEILAGAITVNFDLKLVKSVRAYDLDGNSATNKFGGVVLLEAFDSNGALLGRLISSMLPGQCL